MKILEKLFKTLLILSVLSANITLFSLPVFAVEKDGINFEKVRTETTLDNSEATFNKTSVDINNIKTLPIDKADIANLSEPKKKLGTDLLKLIDNSFLSPNQNRAQVISQMKGLKQFVASGDSVATIDKRVTNRTHNDLVYVYVSLNPTAQTSIIDSFVWKVTDRDEKNHLAVVLVETNKLETLASLSGVRSISSVIPPVVQSGSVVTEGDIIHQTDDVRSAYSQGGAGIKIGVISDGVDNITSSKSTGDLPEGVTVLDNSTGGDEGTAMLEIIYDMVPSVSLYFHNAGSNVIAFNSAIDDLVAAGVNVIVDDIGWITQPFFEDGTIASHVSSVLASNNIVYVSSAGNSGSAGYSPGHYQGEYYNDGINFHDFSRNPATNSYLYLSIPNNGKVTVILQWNDSFGHSGNDYDLYLGQTYRGDLAYSIGIQNGDDDPLEALSYTNTTGSAVTAEIDVNNYRGSAAAKTLELFVYPDNGTWIYNNNLTPADSIFGHPAVQGVIAVGAIAANDPGNDTIESFSSQGPVTIIGQGQIAKPDITGIDGVTITGAGGFSNPFYGTSAAAPHIAAIAAQLWGQYPSAPGNQIRDQILNSAVDLGTAGIDTIFGHGRADSLLAFQAGPTITSFNFAGLTPIVAGVINEGAKTITATVPYGTNITALVPIVVITGASASPLSGASQNFTSPVIYTVTAASGLTQAYVVTVAVAPNQVKAITAFSFPEGFGTVNEVAHTIAVTVPFGTNVTTLVPTIVITGASVNPASGVAHNFTSPVTYTVTAADTTTQDYTVTVTVATPSNVATVTSVTYTVSSGGTATETITNVPFGTAKTTFLAVLSKGETHQTWVDTGISDPVVTSNTLVVTAQDGITIIVYTITVNIAPVTLSSISITALATKLSYTVGDALDIAGLVVTGTYSDASTKVETITIANVAGFNSSTPVAGQVLTITFGGKTTTYTVDIVAVPSPAKAITTFNFTTPAAKGVINEVAHTIAVTVPFGTSVTALVATFTTTGSSVAVGITPQVSGTTPNDFTTPVTYTVTAADSSAQAYMVTVTIAAPSNIATVTSATYTVSSGGTATETITNVPFGISKVAFLTTLTKGQVNQIWNDAGIANPVVTGNTLVVTAQDGTTIVIYTVMVNANPDIAAVVADKVALIDASIQGTNADLSHVTAALTNPLPASGTNGSTITWASNDTGVVSNNGQIVVRPAFGAGNATVTLTATLIKGIVTDTKVFTLTVLEALNPAKAITSFNFASPVTTGVVNEGAKTVSLTVPFGTAVIALVPTIIITGASVSPSSGVAQDFTNSQTYTVTAADSSAQAYVVTVNVSDNPDIASLAADKAALVDDSIKGGNSDLSNITGVLANPLPVSGTVNGSIITWVSSNLAVVSNDGQTINRPAFADGNTTVILTATLTKGAITQTKAFTLIVLKLPASNIATITSGTYTVNNIGSIITGIPYGTESSTFLTGLTKGESHQAWNSSGLTNPVVTGNTLVVTAQDSSTTKTYTLTVALNSAKAITSFNFISPSVIGVINETVHTIAITVPNATDLTVLVPTIAISTGATISPASSVAQDFTDSVTYTVTAADTTTQTYVISVTVVTATQTVPTADGTATANSTTPQVVVSSPTQAVTVTISSGTSNASINYGSLISGGTGTIPQTTINSASADIVIPASTTVTSADSTWDGVIAAPTVTTVTLPETSGQTKTLSTAIEVGFTGAKLSFDKAVRLLLPGQAGKRVGYVRTGITFTEITNICAADNQATGDALATDGDCKISVGSDLIIWTKHFTKFATYTQTVISSSDSSSSSGGGGGGGGGDYTAPTISNINVAVSAKEATITWITNESSISWVVYGTSTSYGLEAKTTTYNTSHSLVLSNLSPVTVYHYSVKSKDSTGNVGSYTDKSFTTRKEGDEGSLSDINNDGKINKYDFSLMMANWGKTGSNNCDLNNDSKVDKYDFALLMLNWSI